MESRNQRRDIDPVVARLIARKARVMNRMPEFRDEEIEDQQQKLRQHWIEVGASYDPAVRDLETYADFVLNNHIRNLRKAKNRLKRDWRACRASLDALVETKDRESLPGHDVYDAERYFDAVDSRGPLNPDDPEFRASLAAALADLSPELRRLAGRLGHQSWTEIASAMGVHRSTLYSWRLQIREVFTKHGLDEFLRPSPLPFGIRLRRKRPTSRSRRCSER